jgi:serine/threonine protein kinase
MLPQVGDNVADYRIERQLGRGGMGVVYLAEQVRLRRWVALKLIVPELAEDEEFRRRFERESQMAASLDHPNVIPVYEAGEADGTLFISMRYVEGSDLRALIRSGGPMEPARAADLVAQAGAALDAAHARGLVHRDVKPANILVAGAPGAEHAYLTDFGLTKHVSSQSGITHTGQWVGTLDYVAPEQISGGPLDARVDVYSLGCVLFEALTGRVPYPRDSDVAKMYAHMNEPPARVSQLAPGAGAAFDPLIDRALAKRPDERYPSTGDLGRAAVAAAQGQQYTAPERSVAAGSAALLTRPHDGPDPTQYGAQPTGATSRLPVAPTQFQDAPPQQPPPPWQPPSTPAPAPASSSSSKWPILAVCATILLLGGVAIALAAAGVFSSKSSGPAPAPTTVIVQNPVETSAQPTVQKTTPTPPAHPSATRTYTTGTYSADFPASWALVSDNEDKGAYTETKMQSPDGGAAVLIDRSPGSALDPAVEAEGVRKDTAKTPGYHEVAFGYTTLGGRAAFEWIFDLPSGRRYDYFTNTSGGRFAVLGTGPDTSTSHKVARSVTASLR